MTNKNILFAEWLAQNHYILYNVENGICYWKNEAHSKSSENLYSEFCLEFFKSQNSVLFIGNRIRDIEDVDCFYEGVIINLTPITYKIDKIIWNGQLDSSKNGDITTLKWWGLEKLENGKWIKFIL